MISSELELLIYIILYVGLEAKAGRVTSFSKPYYALKQANIFISYNKYKKVIDYAQELGLIQISEGILDLGRSPKKILSNRRGRMPSKFLMLTEKGLKLVQNLQVLEDNGFDVVVRKVRTIKPIKDLFNILKDLSGK